MGTSDGRVIPVDMKFDVAFRQGTRTVTPQPTFDAPISLDPERKRPVLAVAAATAESGPVLAAQLGPRDVVLQIVTERKGLVGGGTREESLVTVALPGDGEVTALNVDQRGQNLFVGTSRGQIIRVDLGTRRRRGWPRPSTSPPPPGHRSPSWTSCSATARSSWGIERAG